MVIVKPLQKEAENKMFGQPAGHTFSQVSSSCWFLDDGQVSTFITHISTVTGLGLPSWALQELGRQPVVHGRPRSVHRSSQKSAHQLLATMLRYHVGRLWDE